MGFFVSGLTLEKLEVKTTEFVVSGLTLVLRGSRNEMDFSSGKRYRFIYIERRDIRTKIGFVVLTCFRK